MRKSLVVLAIIAATSVSGAALADVQERKFSVGVSSYATSVDFPQGTDDASGIGLTATAVFNTLGVGHLGLMANYAAMEHDQVNAIDVTNVDASLIWGKNLATEGFKFYVGGGFFSEKWEAGNLLNETFSGVQLTGGIGYNFDRIALDLFVNARPGSGYKFQGTEADGAATAGLSISYRF